MTTQEFLDERFKKGTYYKGKIGWILHEYDNFGADYGLILYEPQAPATQYRLSTFEDSGYTNGRDIAVLNEREVNVLALALCPTNPAHPS